MLPILAGISLMAAFTTMFFHLHVPPTSAGVGNNQAYSIDTLEIVLPTLRTTLFVCPVHDAFYHHVTRTNTHNV